MVSTGTCVSAPRRRGFFVSFAAVLVAVLSACAGSESEVTAPKIVAGAAHACAYDADRQQVVCWGDNSYGQLGNEEFSAEGVSAPVRVKVVSGRKIKSLSAGYSHTCALVSNGDGDTGNTVACWGYNHYGQVGDGTNKDRNVPVFVNGPDGKPLTGATILSAGAFHTCVSMAKGSAFEGKTFCWGRNDKGQIGNGSLVNVNEPTQIEGVDYSGGVAAGTAHTCALTAKSVDDARANKYVVVCWGDASRGQMRGAALPGNLSYATKPVEIGLNLTGSPALYSEHVVQSDVTTATSQPVKGAPAPTVGTTAYGQTCAINNDEVLCWGGANQNGQWGTDKKNLKEFTVKADEIESESSLVAYGAGHAQACMLAGSSVACWGYSSSLGIELDKGTADAVAASSRKAVTPPGAAPTGLAVGRDFVCYAGRGEQPQIWCWGNGTKGQLGNGRVENQRLPRCVTGYCPTTSRAANAAKGQPFQVAPEPLPGIGYIAAGEDNSCGSATNVVYCWGAKLQARGNGWIVAPGTLPEPKYDLGGTPTFLGTGYYQRCAISTTSSLECWGNSISGAGLGETIAAYEGPRVLPGFESGVYRAFVSKRYVCATITRARSDAGDLLCYSQASGTTAVLARDVLFAALSRDTEALCVSHSNGSVECGDGTTFVKMAVSGAYTLVSGGKRFCAGIGSQISCWEQLGSATEYSTPTFVQGVSDVDTTLAYDLAVGENHVCYVTELNTVKCWGSGGSGQLGNGKFADSSEPVVVQGLPDSVLYQLVAGNNHTCVVTLSQTVHCWGKNDLGQLGDGTVQNRAVAVPVGIGERGVRDPVTVSGDTITEGEAQQRKITVTIPVLSGDQRYAFDCDGDGSFEVDGKVAGHECYYSRLSSGAHAIGYQIGYRGAGGDAIETGQVQFNVDNAPPVISAIQYGTATLKAWSAAATHFTISAVVATDPGKDKLSYDYDCNLDGKIEGPAETNLGAGPVACDVSGVAPGTYSLLVVVTDADNAAQLNGQTRKPITLTLELDMDTRLDAMPPRYSGKNVAFAFSSTPFTTTIETKLDAAPWAVTTSGTRSFAALAEGTHTFMARAVTGGYAGTVTSYAWVVDTLAPVTVADTSFTQPVGTDSVTVQFHANDANAAAGFTYTCALDGGSASDCTSPLNVGPVFEGSHTLVVYAADRAGNATTSPATITWSYYVPPETTLDAAGPNGTVSQTTGTFTFTSPTATGFQCRLDGGAWTTCTSPYTTPTLANGSHTVEIRAVRNGVPDATAASRTWTVDTGAVAQPPVTGSTLSAGNSHSCAVSGGKMYCWGFAGPHLGELVGPPEFNGAYLPTQMGSLADWVSVSAAGSSGHTCGIRASGTLYCWGGNAYGQLGSQTVDTYFSSAAPLTVAVGQTWRKVAAIDSHTCAVRQDQSLWCWGGNGSGEVGIGAASYAVTSPAQVGAATNWIDVGGGYAFTCALNASGALYCWGDGSEGQLGVGATTGFASPLTAAATGVASMTAGGQYVCVVKSNGTLWCWGYNATSQGGNAVTDRTLPSQVGTATDWKLVEAGVNSTCALKTNGTRWCWGDWTNNALGDDNALGGTQATPVQIGSEADWVELTCGAGFCLGVRGTATPNVFAWGDNQFNRAGRNADTEPVISPMVQLTPY
jgi:alpha-tubulin suppressor-like RCC1 family protein